MHSHFDGISNVIEENEFHALWVAFVVDGDDDDGVLPDNPKPPKKQQDNDKEGHIINIILLSIFILFYPRLYQVK